MESTVQKWGNSNGVRIPNIFLKNLKIKTNDKVEIINEGDKIIITKPAYKKISLEEKFKNYKGKNLTNEFQWDTRLGNEIW